MKKLTLIFLYFLNLSVFSTPVFSATTENTCPLVSVCFTPQQNCTASITETINQAKKYVYVQAYSFTSKPIARALIEAKKRGVLVEVIYDKDIQNNKSREAKKVFSLLKKNGVIVWKDNIDGLAHNKVIVIDDDIVITGSFNFTFSAQHRNAENLLIIRDSTVAKKYEDNWLSRKTQSVAFDSFNS